MSDPAIAIHAGAGAIPDHPDEVSAQLEVILDRAAAAIARGDSALEVAQRAVAALEDFELFNAGTGSALCSDGSVQMSASVMRGDDLAAGAVACVRTVRNPVCAARVVLDTPQLLMVGPAAEALAAGAGLASASNEAFITARQRERLARGIHSDHGGTVGAVVRDAAGVLAAATSTGGLMGQPPGRVGDTPLIGAGTWADSRSAISCTGDGEAFIRVGVARLIAAQLERDASDADALERAAVDVLTRVGALGGAGGLIALGASGPPVMPFTTASMPRGWWTPKSRVQARLV